MNNDKNHENDNKVNENDIKKHSIKDYNSYGLKEKVKFYEEEDLSSEVKNVLNEVFTDMNKVDDNVETKISDEYEESKTEPSITDESTIRVSKNDLKKEIGQQNIGLFNNIEELKETPEKILENLKKEDYSSFKHKLTLLKELESFHENKLKELEEKIKVYNEKHKKLEKTIEEYDERNNELVEKRKEYEERVKEFEEKSKSMEESKEELMQRVKQLEESKEEFTDRNTKLKEAREQFMELSKQMEEKKRDLEKWERKLEKLQKNLEKSKFDLERNKIEFEKNKLEFEISKSESEKSIDVLSTKEVPMEIKREEDRITILDKKEKKKGRAAILQDMLEELSYKGDFQSCLLIDGKGMLISEHSKKKLDEMAIGAMFSLVCTNILRAIKSLNLQELEYFKMASTNGEFMLKNIDITNYERNFILIAHYIKSDSILPDITQKINKKAIKKILDSVKRDFNEFGRGTKISWVFDNLENKVNFLKETYKTPEKDVELIRRNLLNKTSIKVKELFKRNILIDLSSIIRLGGEK
ncbi:MAG: hypothetical protein ACFFB0_13265, partial [Promethearchaeota archaeon]